MLNLLIFLIVIGVLVFVHELGHFLAAKISGIQVDAFALGFGPKILAFKKGETQYQINLLPFGGYVKMAGEGDYQDPEAEKNPRGFEVQPAHKKLFVILAGVTMNFILACVIYTGFMIHYSYSQNIPQIVPNSFPFGTVSSQIGFQVDPYDTTSPIYKYHLNSTYIFKSIDGQQINSAMDVENMIKANKGKEVSIAYTDTNGKNPHTIIVVPRENPPKGKGSVGIVLSPISNISFTGWQKPVSGVLYSIDMLQYNVSALVTLTQEAIKTKTASLVTSNLTGPVGIYEVTGAVYQQAGVIGILNIIALLSLALALMNVLPLPVLDGGFAVIIIIESITRKPLSARVKTFISNIGIGMLVLLMLFVTYNDINNFDIITKITHLFGR